MMCFGFNCDSQALSVSLCDEIIEYHTYRSEGIPITGNIVVKSDDDKEKYLGIWHRTHLEPFRISGTADWSDSTDLYTHISSSLTKDRARFLQESSTLRVKLFSEKQTADPTTKDLEFTEAQVPKVDGSPGSLRIRYPIKEELNKIHLKEPDVPFVPFTYAEIGPFTGKNKYYAIRVSAKINDPSFGRLVPENPRLGTRYYQVYGISEILDKIDSLDLPDLRWNSSPEVFNVYESIFAERMRSHKLVPDFYSIITLDSPNTCNYEPHRLYTIEMRKGLKDLTDEIHEFLYEHKQLSSLRNRVFWFVNCEHSQDFMLWLEGPMAEVQELLAKTR